MMVYSITQAFIIALVVAWSTWFALRRTFPTASRRVQAHVVTWLERSVRSPLLQRWAHALQPVQTQSGGCGTSGCSTCGACAPTHAANADAQPLVFHPRAKP
ncbi:MAG TPA: DUF6587 family protein [Rhodanobacteraceae bacterium]|nr:DUF6587 family protein [Rhodanobacteraceae bacterium]